MYTVEYKGICHFLRNLIVHPRRVIKSTDIISYDLEKLSKLYYVVSTILGIILIVLQERFNYYDHWMDVVGLLVFKLSLGLLVAPIAAILVLKLMVLFHFVVQWIGGIRASFEVMETLLFPIVFIYFTGHCFFSIVFCNYIFIQGILNVFIWIWFHVLMFWIYQDKYKQGVPKSFFLAGIPMSIGLIAIGI